MGVDNDNVNDNGRVMFLGVGWLVIGELCVTLRSERRCI